MSPSELTIDRSEIEEWADEHDVVPVREGDRLELVPEAEVEADHDRLDWDTFYGAVDEDRVVIRHTESSDLRGLAVADRNETLDHVAVDEADDRNEIERRLVDGETITGTVTETTEIQETIVEEATLETEVVDRELVDRRVTDVDLLDSSCQSCELSGNPEESTAGPWLDADRFPVDDTATTGEIEEYEAYPFDITAEVDETWAVTIQERHQYTVETRITDVDVTETDTVDTRDLEANIDVETIHEQLVDSDLVDVTADEMIDSDRYSIESEFTEDDAITTYLIAQTSVEREVSEQRRLTAEVVEGELLARDTTRKNRQERSLAERDRGRSAEGTAFGADVDDETTRVTPNANDEGKPVVVSTGDQIGMVTDVEGTVAYVDPHPGLTEKLSAKLGWGGIDEGDLPVDESQIAAVTSDAVRLSGDYSERELEKLEMPE